MSVKRILGRLKRERKAINRAIAALEKIDRGESVKGPGKRDGSEKARADTRQDRTPEARTKEAFDQSNLIEFPNSRTAV